MPSWEEVRKMVINAQSPQEREEAARAMRAFTGGNNADKSLVNMRKGGIHAVKLGNLPEEMAKNPQVYNTVRKAIGG